MKLSKEKKGICLSGGGGGGDTKRKGRREEIKEGRRKTTHSGVEVGKEVAADERGRGEKREEEDEEEEKKDEGDAGRAEECEGEETSLSFLTRCEPYQIPRMKRTRDHLFKWTSDTELGTGTQCSLDFGGQVYRGSGPGSLV
ncbi:unnamed protein product [Merluccius merluccius]